MKTNTSDYQRQEKGCVHQDALVKMTKAAKEMGKEGADGNC